MAALVALQPIAYSRKMPFNHYAKIKRILDDQPPGWFIRRIEAVTTAKNFKGETVFFPHYYRVYDRTGDPIKYCKFQQLDRLAGILKIDTEDLPVITETEQQVNKTT